METLFIRFAAIYGYLWVTTYGNPEFLEVSKREWSESLKGFDNQVLKIALGQIKKTQLFPPTLPLFTECCKSIKKSIDAREKSLKQKVESHTPCDPKVVEYHINQMKEDLFKSQKEQKSC